MTIIDDGKLRKAITAASLGKRDGVGLILRLWICCLRVAQSLFPRRRSQRPDDCRAGHVFRSLPDLRPLGGLFLVCSAINTGARRSRQITIVIMSISTPAGRLTLTRRRYLGANTVVAAKWRAGLLGWREYTARRSFVANIRRTKRGFM